jgi:hypothetical protein
MSGDDIGLIIPNKIILFSKKPKPISFVTKNIGSQRKLFILFLIETQNPRFKIIPSTFGSIMETRVIRKKKPDQSWTLSIIINDKIFRKVKSNILL